MKPSLKDLIACAARESHLRRMVYPKASMPPATKERELRAMDAIEQLLRDLDKCPEAKDALRAAGFHVPFNPQPNLL